MQIERKEVFELLKQVPLFSHLETSDLDWASSLFQFTIFHPGEIVFDVDHPSNELYLIFEGRVQITAVVNQKLCLCSMLKRGDVFGEEALIFDDPRYYTATAQSDVILLRLTVQSYLENIERLSGVYQKLEVMVNSRMLSLKVRLPWLQEDEYVHVMTRRHKAILWKNMLFPVLFGIGAIIFSGLLQWLWFPGRSIGLIALPVFVLLTLLWLLWNYFDWRNDYFVVTNKRVVWIEKVALIYESRQEAPLRTIMSVGLQRSRVGSVLDMADVVVMTYVGTIRLQNLQFAETIASLVESYWQHSDNKNRADESQVMTQMLHEKMDLPWQEDDETRTTVVTPEAPQQSEPTNDRGFLKWLLSGFLQLRYESGGVITYRKHWFILVKKTFIPLVLMILSFVGLAVRLGGRLYFIKMSTAIISFLMLSFIFFVWIIYQYADWRNDQYKVTFDQIIDIDRKPLGKIRRRSAPLENVLSIEYRRKGLWGYLLNFGTVFITVGNMKLTFDYVYKPSDVQQDIFYRMGERLESIRQFEIDSERDRISEWIASYHREIQKLDPQVNRQKTDDDSTSKIG